MPTYFNRPSSSMNSPNEISLFTIHCCILLKCKINSLPSFGSIFDNNWRIMRVNSSCNRGFFVTVTLVSKICSIQFWMNYFLFCQIIFYRILKYFTWKMRPSKSWPSSEARIFSNDGNRDRSTWTLSILFLTDVIILEYDSYRFKRRKDILKWIFYLLNAGHFSAICTFEWKHSSRVIKQRSKSLKWSKTI